MESPQDLERRFGSERIRFDAGPGGLTRVRLSAGGSEAELFTYGAHVTGFRRAGDVAPVLFLSERSAYTPGKAIRGGIPVIFPWFGAHPGDPAKPAHGFARTSEWSVAGVRGEGEHIAVSLRLESNERTRSLWPYDFAATLDVVLGRELLVSLEVLNTSAGAMAFEEALHTYFEVGDVGRVRLHGLEHTTYIDKTDGMKRRPHGAVPLTIERETDSVFLETEAACTIEDAALGRSITVSKSGSRSTVVWNPHQAKGPAMSDLGDGWRRMICVETCNVADHAVHLDSGERWTMNTVIACRAPGEQVGS